MKNLLDSGSCLNFAMWYIVTSLIQSCFIACVTLMVKMNYTPNCKQILKAITKKQTPKRGENE